MEYIKRLIILTGERGRGAVTVETTAAGSICRTSIKERSGERLYLAVKEGERCFVERLKDAIALPFTPTEEAHYIVIDADLREPVLYGTQSRKRLWRANMADGVMKYVVEKQRGESAPQSAASERKNAFSQTPDEKKIKYDDEAIAMHDYYLYTGDGEFYLEMKPHLCQAADWLIARAGDSGLIDIPANPLNVWMVVLDGAGGTDPYMNELFRRSVRVAVEVCRLAGDDERSAGYSAFLEKLDPAVDGLLARQPLTGKKSLYQHSMGIFEVIETLFSEGKPHEALQLLRNAWEKLLSSGADTLYEGLYGDYPDITVRHPDRKAGHVSYCHGWTAGPCCLLASEIAGIKPAEPGFRRFTVAPRPAGLTSFEVVVPTPLGEIALLLKDGRYTLLVPEGAEAAVSLDGRQFRLNAGIHTF